MRARSAGLIAMIGLALVAAAGCGGSSKGPSSAPAVTTTPTPTSPTSPSSPGAIPGADPQLAPIVLTATEVASAGGPVGERLLHGGTEVAGQATLDECGATYPSESMRQARIQVAYIPVGSAQRDAASISNEVVRYAPGGASAAEKELDHVLNTCPASVKNGSATETKVQIVSRDPQLLQHQITAIAFYRVKGQGSAWSAASFQWNGDLFSGVYVFRPTKAAALKVDRQLAAISADKLTTSNGTET
jgi:hypothetical protein